MKDPGLRFSAEEQKAFTSPQTSFDTLSHRCFLELCHNAFLRASDTALTPCLKGLERSHTRVRFSAIDFFWPVQILQYTYIPKTPFLGGIRKMSCGCGCFAAG